MTRRTVLSLLLVLGLVAGACSSGAEDGTVASLGTDAGDIKVRSAETESIPGEDAVLAFAACLRDEGRDTENHIRPASLLGYRPNLMREL